MKPFRLLALLAILPGMAVAQTTPVPYTLPNITTPEGYPRTPTLDFTLNPGTTPVDGSGTVTAGTVSQQIFAANPKRLFLSVQNPITATETLFVNVGANASTTGGSYEIAPGGTLSWTGSATPTSTVTVTAATTAHRFIAKQGAPL